MKAPRGEIYLMELIGILCKFFGSTKKIMIDKKTAARW
jgi:hypothetical protein